MKHWATTIILSAFCLLQLSCNDKDLEQPGIVGDNVTAALNFGITANDRITIKTRTTYDIHYESMVRNIYAFVFANGEKIYGHYFDETNINSTGNKDYWQVDNLMSDDTEGQTTGTLHMSVPSVAGVAEIILIANIDLDFMNVSQERLGLVRTKNDLNELIVSLNQEIPDRNAGYFMMTGSQDNVSISSDGLITVPGGKIMLHRLDAKVEVNVRVNPNEESNNQRVEEFTPESWQVINLPKSSYLLPNSSSLILPEESCFNITPKNFEKTENEIIDGNATGGVLHGFSFYTLENKRSAEKKKGVEGNYHDRDRRNKHNEDPEDADYGTYDNENGMWEYAPELATYMIIKGELKMVIDPGSTSEQHLVADVTYYVHLGDFAKDKDNYDIQRNTHYKYTINIKGVENIEIEVDTSNDNLPGITENQPGAMGHLYEAEEDIYTFDAHYGQRVYTIKANEVDTDNMTWYVRTPFGREGIPAKDDTGKEIYNDLDYKWVEFMLNEKSVGDNSYSDSNMPYPADKSSLMNVIEMLGMVKAEVLAWRENRESKFDENGEMKFTIFVNEFYYEENPMNPNDQDILWKKFVNQPNRLMHILCKNNRSADNESSVTGSILTIRQNSIQTPYNISRERTDLNEAWGCETKDETNNEAWFYHPDERLGNLSASHMPSYTPDNTSRTDGLYNTACLINLISGTGNGKSVNGNLRWDTFIDYSGNDVKLKEQYRSGLYSVLLRNRDLDGDGIIDPEELRWYLASLDQLCGLFIGDQGLSSDAQLYPIAASREPNTTISGGVFNGVFPWRIHVVSSTAWLQTAGNVPTIVWAEEGASTGEYQVHWGKPGYSPVRCIRNLGLTPATADNICIAGENYPEDLLVNVERPSGTISKNSVYRFDMRNMNKESLRAYYTTHELVPDNEYSSLARLYDGFETGVLQQYTTTNPSYNELKTELESGGSPSPAGYRVPNLREGVIMHLYCDNATWWDGNKGTLVSNFYSFGYHGNRYDYINGEHFYSWSIYNDRVTIGNNATQYIRFVKDIQP
ncbi:MAG: DUF4906 domain-containing protein [Bacteroidaceae bacterium]|nr:DUF4906 domain-containing protein [Bacteroidaceae bacterium]